jgi:hypothetical protein
MWWKLVGLLVVTAVLIVSVIPFRTHAVAYDPMKDPPPPRPSFLSMFANMYLTPGTAVAILVILGLAGFVAMKVIRGHW